MPVLFCSDINLRQLQSLLERYNLELQITENNKTIPGSFWQAPEAGLIGNTLFVRQDTPVHSALHEASHYVCMDNKRRSELDTNAGGDYQEEDAVCFLQILLSDFVQEMKHERMLNDMDEWGYSFRLGSAKTWFEQDAEDALAWLQKYQIVNAKHKVTWKVRL